MVDPSAPVADLASDTIPADTNPALAPVIPVAETKVPVAPSPRLFPAESFTRYLNVPESFPESELPMVTSA